MNRKGKNTQDAGKWVLTVVILSFSLSVVMSLATGLFVESAGIAAALLAVIVLVAVGIATDMIGTAVTGAREQPVIAMCSKKIPGAKKALWMVRNAGRVSSVMCDIIGDIVGVVSGSAGSVIALTLASYGLPAAGASVLLTALISSFMIGGKACGKRIALERSEDIVLLCGKILEFPGKKKTRNQKQGG